jgi:hypothetical protein
MTHLEIITKDVSLNGRRLPKRVRVEVSLVDTETGEVVHHEREEDGWAHVELKLTGSIDTLTVQKGAVTVHANETLQLHLEDSNVDGLRVHSGNVSVQGGKVRNAVAWDKSQLTLHGDVQEAWAYGHCSFNVQGSVGELTGTITEPGQLVAGSVGIRQQRKPVAEKAEAKWHPKPQQQSEPSKPKSVTPAKRKQPTAAASRIVIDPRVQTKL